MTVPSANANKSAVSGMIEFGFVEATKKLIDVSRGCCCRCARSDGMWAGLSLVRNVRQLKRVGANILLEQSAKCWLRK